ncbi:MAG: hypothetical protein IH986_18400 [Planctomycetes bacterium]|nr:hypothetical protein [Planctomycetota bacterium]
MQRRKERRVLTHFDDVAHGGRAEHCSVSACRTGFLGKDDAVRSTETASGEAASIGSVMMADKRSVLRVRRRFGKRYACLSRAGSVHEAQALLSLRLRIRIDT